MPLFKENSAIFSLHKAYILPTLCLHSTYILLALSPLYAKLFLYYPQLLSLGLSRNSLENLMLTLSLRNRQPVSLALIL